MQVNVTIGEFSRMTHLTVKTLRHYHRVGLLAPAQVDEATGYRYYTTGQVPTAQIIRRFRELDMPVEQLRTVLATPDPQERTGLILAHLERLEHQLSQTQNAVSALRLLLAQPQAPVAVAYRTAPAVPVLALSETVSLSEVSRWWTETFNELHAVLGQHGIQPAGPDGALWATELFTQGHGASTLFVPTRGLPVSGQRAHPVLLPAVELAVTTPPRRASRHRPHLRGTGHPHRRASTGRGRPGARDLPQLPAGHR
jgi:DNA-binding transcriptional MerR regulator